MKSFDVYILHDASLVVCLSEYLPFFMLTWSDQGVSIDFRAYTQLTPVFREKVIRAGRGERSNILMSFWP